MAYVWTSITAGQTKAIDTHFNEVYTAVNDLSTRLGIAAYGWVQLPVTSGDRLNKVQIDELQDSIDYIDINNVCSANYASKYFTAWTTRMATFNNTNYTTLYSTANTAYNLTERNILRATARSSQNTTRYGTRYEPRYGTRYNTRYGTRRGTLNSTYLP